MYLLFESSISGYELCFELSSSVTLHLLFYALQSVVSRHLDTLTTIHLTYPTHSSFAAFLQKDIRTIT